MARPESLDDIEIEQKEFATVDVDIIADNGALLKAYATFMEAVQNARGDVEVRYGSSARFTRPPSDKEMKEQLSTAQSLWDEQKKYYEQLRDIGDVEHSYQRTYAQQYAKNEGLPFPPQTDPISDFHKVISDIDESIEA